MNIIRKVQDKIQSILTSGTQLGNYCPILVENIKDVEFSIKKHLGQQGIVAIIVTPTVKYQGQASNLYKPAYLFEDLTIQFIENPAINRKFPNYKTSMDCAIEALEILTQGANYGSCSPRKIETTESQGFVVSKLTVNLIANE